MGDVQQQRAEWPSKKRLYELYWGEGLSFPQIAETVDASGVAVRRMFKHYGIPSRDFGSRFSGVMYANGWARTPLPSPYDTAWMHRRVRDDGMSLAAVARELDTRPETVAQQLRTVDLHPNTESFGDEPWQNREWLWRQFRRDRRSTTEVAAEQGIRKRVLRRWTTRHDIQRPDQRWTKKAQASMQADGNEELSDAAKALDPTIKSKDTPDELINDTFAFGTNNAMGGRQGQR